MTNAKALNTGQINEILEKAATNQTNCVMSHLTKGKWHRLDSAIHSVNAKTLIIEILDTLQANRDVQIDQPLGMALEFDFKKYIFESAVIGLQPNAGETPTSKIIIKRPLAVEQVQRRSYTRVPIPSDLKVNTLFWHRGYTDNSTDVPIDNYWQGVLTDLSAGGTQVKVTKDLAQNFRQGQFIGMQFTPLPYEKPVILEGQIKHIADNDGENEIIFLGIEFLGLEASTDGREKLNKIVETIAVYQKK
jgi:c-di-GMP-binding flagellar brake protein YcgR